MILLIYNCYFPQKIAVDRKSDELQKDPNKLQSLVPSYNFELIYKNSAKTFLENRYINYYKSIL